MRFTKLQYFFLIIFISGCLPLLSQKPYTPEILDPLLEPWRWKFIPELRGKGVRCIADDTNGSIWFGVNKGVYRYDGMEWTFFGAEVAEIGFPVNVICASNNGTVYAGSEKGLSFFQNRKWTSQFSKEESAIINVSSIRAFDDGSIIIGVNQGFIFIKDQKNYFFTVQRNLSQLKTVFKKSQFIVLPDDFLIANSSPRIDDFFEKSPVEFWVLTSQAPAGRIFSLDLKKTILKGKIEKFEVLSEINKQPLGSRQQVIQTRDNKIWIISALYSSGIFTFDGKRWEFVKLSRLFGGDELHTSIMETADGTIWMGGLGKLFVLKNNKWNLYEAPQFPIPYSRLIFHESKNGNLWIAGIQNEVFRFDYSDSKWETFNNLNFECETKDHKKWFLCADNRVVVNYKNTWYSFDEQDSLIDTPVRLIVSRSGKIWAAGSHKGIAATACFDGFHWFRQTHPNLSWGIDYRAVYETNDGSIWFGASVDAQTIKGQLAGVLRLNTDRNGNMSWIHYTSRDGIAQQNAYGIGQSVDGTVWMGGTQLLKFDGQKWGSIDQPEYLKQFVNCIYNKPGSKLWVGSRFYGLFSFDGKNWQHFNTENGLSSNLIISIFAQTDTSVWVATDNDICRFDGKTWTRELFHPQMLMTREGGSINVSADSGVWINKSLREWKRRAFTFNTAPKFAYENFRTTRYKPDKLYPKTAIKVFTKKVDHSGNTVISWIGKDYWEDTPIDQLSYSYRLNNDEWSAFQNQTYQTFTNLSDGEYSFEVRSRDLDFNIDQHPAKIFFTVLPPVWKQLWFILLVLAFITAISYYEIQSTRRNRKLKRLNLSLIEVNQELYQQKEEITAKNEEITGQQEKILYQKEQLSDSNILLEKQNEEIKAQRDKLKEMVEKVEELSRTKLSFFTNISHEFRTPLTLILGPVERLISTEIKDELEKFNLYGIIHRSAQRLLRLINQILEFRKIETGAVELTLRKDDIIYFLTEVVYLFNGLALQRKINFALQSSVKSIQTAFDHDKIEKIVFNLLSNAFKFTPEGGNISVDINWITGKDQLNDSENQDFVKINVIDTGQGIAPEHISHIFERFYQVKDNHAQSSGTGIGLAYIKELVEIHGGRISVTSEPGKGTNFKVEIPIIKDDSIKGDKLPESYTPKIYFSGNIQPVIKEISQNASLAIISDPTSVEINEKLVGFLSDNAETILIVEDDLDLMAYLKSNLPGYKVITAKNGLEAWEKAQEIQPDLVISDIMMPEMDGIELCHHLKTNLITSHIPVILLTAKTLVEHKIAGLESGADDYIEKPFNMQLLQIRSRNLIESRKKLRELFRREIFIEPNEVTVTSTDEKLLKSVINLIEQNISEPAFNIEELCKQFFLSRSHFTRKIKQITGYSPIELMVSYRLKRAAQLIIMDKLSIAEIAYMVGFEHPNSLSRSFRKHFGLSPTEYSKKKE